MKEQITLDNYLEMIVGYMEFPTTTSEALEIPSLAIVQMHLQVAIIEI